MPKAKCMVGFEHTSQLDPINKPGVYTENIVEKSYYAEVLKHSSRNENSSQQVNVNITLGNQFSILADPYLKENFSSIRYINYMGTKWRVSNIDVQFPRLILSLGGLYNDH